MHDKIMRRDVTICGKPTDKDDAEFGPTHNIQIYTKSSGGSHGLMQQLDKCNQFGAVNGAKKTMDSAGFPFT